MTNDGLGKRLFEKMFWTLTQTTQTFECFSVFVHIHYIAMRVSFQFNMNAHVPYNCCVFLFCIIIVPLMSLCWKCVMRLHKRRCAMGFSKKCVQIDYIQLKYYVQILAIPAQHIFNLLADAKKISVSCHECFHSRPASVPLTPRSQYQVGR